MKARICRRIAILLLGAMSIILGAGILHILHHTFVSPIEHYCGLEQGEPCRTSEDDGCVYLDIIPPPAILATGAISLTCIVTLLAILYASRVGSYRPLRLVDRYSLSDPPYPQDIKIGLSPEGVRRACLQGI